MGTRRAWAGAALAAVLVTGCSGEPEIGTGPDPTDQPAGQPTEDGASFHDVLPEFTSAVQPVGPAVRARMTGSHRAGCPVALEQLRYVTVRFVGFDGQAHLGELVVHRRYADDVASVFATLYEARFPIERMQLVDEYGGDDDASMAANNTSAYNCRPVAGTDRWSNHAYGSAIDINPLQNPYVQGDRVDPPAGSEFAGIDRSAGAEVPRGVIADDDVVVRAFASVGWEWGGHWRSSQDYQHFSAAGS